MTFNICLYVIHFYRFELLIILCAKYYKEDHYLNTVKPQMWVKSPGEKKKKSNIFPFQNISVFPAQLRPLWDHSSL